MDRPLLLINVDGVISLFGFGPAQPPAGRFELVDGIANSFPPPRANSFASCWHEFELAGCTGWEEKLNEYLPLALGLPVPYPT